MARGNTYTCVVCGKQHTFCPKCQIAQPNWDYNRFCSKAHADIFAILSKNGCHLATDDETLNALDPYDLTGLNEDIQAHIDSLKPTIAETKVEAKAEIKTEAVAVEAKTEVKKEPVPTKKWKYHGQE